MSQLYPSRRTGYRYAKVNGRWRCVVMRDEARHRAMTIATITGLAVLSLVWWIFVL